MGVNSHDHSSASYKAARMSGDRWDKTIMKNQTFEEYLMEVHADGYMGTDDDMTEAYEAWVSDLQVDTLIAYAQDWGNKLTK